MSRTRAVLANLALALAAIAFVLSIGEAALRLAGYTPAAYLHTNRVANGRRTILLDCYPSNPRRYFPIDLRDPATLARYRALAIARLDEAAATTPYAVERRFNSRQFRGPEIGPKPPGVRRVVVIGDSFTEGMGVEEEDAYPRVLGRLLAAADPGRWEVLNCGRRGYDFPALFDLFETVLALDPDVVVYGLVLNDPVRTPEFQQRQRSLNDWILDRGRMFRGEEPRLSPWRPRLFALASDRVEQWRLGRETTTWYRDMYGEPNRAGWERTQQYLREMDRRMEERGGAFLVAEWPILVALDGRYPFADVSETIARFCLTAGIARHDLRPALAARRTESLWVHPVDHHPNEVAHRLAAESLLPALRALADRKP